MFLRGTYVFPRTETSSHSLNSGCQILTPNVVNPSTIDVDVESESSFVLALVLLRRMVRLTISSYVDDSRITISIRRRRREKKMVSGIEI